MAVGVGAAAATEGVVEGLKKSVGWQRPDHSGHDSFPSGPAALTSVAATMTQRNIDTLPISGTSQFALRSLAVGLSVRTHYARVAARKHYRSDVLISAARGHFIGEVADEAFLGVPVDRFVPTVSLSRHSGTVVLRRTLLTTSGRSGLPDMLRAGGAILRPARPRSAAGI